MHKTHFANGVNIHVGIQWFTFSVLLYTTYKLYIHLLDTANQTAEGWGSKGLVIFLIPCVCLPVCLSGRPYQIPASFLETGNLPSWTLHHPMKHPLIPSGSLHIRKPRPQVQLSTHKHSWQQMCRSLRIKLRFSLYIYVLVYSLLFRDCMMKLCSIKHLLITFWTRMWGLAKDLISVISSFLRS